MGMHPKGISCGAPVVFANPPTSRYRHISSLKIVDIKCPSSHASQKNDLENLKRLNPKDQIKFVIGNRTDYVYAKKTMALNRPDFPEDHILFSPISGEMPPEDLAE